MRYESHMVQKSLYPIIGQLAASIPYWLIKGCHLLARNAQEVLLPHYIAE